MANETVLVDLGSTPPRAWWCGCRRWRPRSRTTTSRRRRWSRTPWPPSGVPAPAPAVVVDQSEWIGSSFLADAAGGHGDIPGPAPFFDPYVREADPGDSNG